MKLTYAKIPFLFFNFYLFKKKKNNFPQSGHYGHTPPNSPYKILNNFHVRIIYLIELCLILKNVYMYIYDIY